MVRLNWRGLDCGKIEGIRSCLENSILLFIFDICMDVC